MPITPSPCGLIPEPVRYTILIRGQFEGVLHSDFPHMVITPVGGDSLLTGLAPHRDDLFALLRWLSDSGIELLSASASPPDDSGSTDLTVG